MSELKNTKQIKWEYSEDEPVTIEMTLWLGEVVVVASVLTFIAYIMFGG